ncbi:MAG: hypothetical protein AAGA28_06875 [Pseudomonadota bacterium]
MKAAVIIFSSCAVLAGCAVFEGLGIKPAPEEVPAPEPDVTAQPAVLGPPEGARTAEDFDTTSAAERQDALIDASASDGRRLGRTIASLGDVAEPGIWLKTPLVTRPQRGSVVYAAKGTSVAVDLMPLDAEPGSGSRISLAAMRLLQADLTALPEIDVFTLSP